MTLVERGDDAVMAAGERSETSLVLPEGLSFEEWLAIGRPLLAAAESVQWWVGDWLVYGDRHYGHLQTAANELNAVGPDALARYERVAEMVPPERRRSDLSWTHHHEVRLLEPEAQTAWLNSAAEARWSSRELAAELRAAGQESGGGDATPGTPARPAVSTSVKAGVELVVRGEATHIEMLRAATDAVESQLRDHAHDLAVRLRSHLADAGVSAVVEVR